MTDSKFSTEAELDAAYPAESALGYMHEIRDLVGPALYPEAIAEIRERQRVCELPLHEAARIVRDNYRAGTQAVTA